MTTIYKQDLGHPNWTGRVSRQSRITGEWSNGRRASRVSAWEVAAIVFGVIAFWGANFI